MKTKRTFYVLIMLTLMLGIFAGCSKRPARTDAQIASEVQSRFYGDPAIQSREIRVQAANGVVTLSGDVTSESERGAAADDAAEVDGVRTVVNNLQVQQAQTVPPPPAAGQSPAHKKPSKRANKSAVASTRHRLQDASESVSSADDAMQASDTPPPQTAPAMQATPPPPPPPPPPQPPQKITIPAGTQLTVRLNDPLDSERNQVGDTFHGSLSAPIVIDGDTVIPSGADVVG